MPPLRSSRNGTHRSSQTPARSGGVASSSSARSRPAPSSTSTTLPPYEAPIAPLNRAGVHALSTLALQHDLGGLHQRHSAALERLGLATAELHELKAHRERAAATAARRRAERGEKADPDGDAALATMLERIDTATVKLEAQVRAVLDRQAGAEAQEEALREVSANRGAAGGLPPPPRATQSTWGAPTQGTMAPEGAEDEAPEAEPAAASVLEAVKQKRTAVNDAYAALTMRERYSANNAYIDFRRMLHDAQHPDDDAAAPPLPHASTWFDEVSGQPRYLGIGGGNTAAEPTASQGGSGAEGAGHPSASQAQPASGSLGDVDIEAVAERTSIRCPLTLGPMRDAVTSRKCPHSFERAAILEYLGVTGPGGRRGRPRAAKCPVCEVMLTQEDLADDPILQRRIRRIQAAEARAGEGSDEDEGDDQRRPVAEMIPSSSPAPSSARMQIKNERLSRGPSRRGGNADAMDVEA